jgi:hypothetical protein
LDGRFSEAGVTVPSCLLSFRFFGFGVVAEDPEPPALVEGGAGNGESGPPVLPFFGVLTSLGGLVVFPLFMRE